MNNFADLLIGLVVCKEFFPMVEALREQFQQQVDSIEGNIG